MQRRDSLRETTNIAILSTGSTRRFKSRRSQSSISSISDVFTCLATSEGHSDLSVSRMELRSEKNLDGVEGRNAEARAAYKTATDSFEGRKQTLIRPEHHHHEELESPVMTLNWKGSRNPRVPRSVARLMQKRNC